MKRRFHLRHLFAVLTAVSLVAVFRDAASPPGLAGVVRNEPDFTVLDRRARCYDFMINVLCVAILVVIIAGSSGCGSNDGTPETVSKAANGAQTSDTTSMSGPNGLASAVTQVRHLDFDSYHLFLREVSLLVPPRCVGQQWSTVTTVLKQHEIPIVESWDNGDALHASYLAREKAFQLSHGHSLDLQLELSAKCDDRPNLSERSCAIYAAHAVLVDNVDAPYAELIRQKRYPKGSILDVVVRSNEVKAVGDAWPLISRVSVYYGYLFDRWRKHNPSGFHVTLEFTASLDKEIAEKTMSFRVPSGLDPLRALDGKEVQLDGFSAQDSLGDISGGGGTETWHGGPDVVEANEKKYLRNRK